ncbi:hypothetical protein [Pelagibacterium mangrovi]|uniref:hypothetical protein n=1 Tax=Pelagibacterium mangrovi TaxID=3119828 RepID=UPI002FC6D993
MRSKPDSQPSNERRDGRRPLLVYLDPKLIQALKVEALEKRTHVYLLMEDILKERRRDRP